MVMVMLPGCGSEDIPEEPVPEQENVIPEEQQEPETPEEPEVPEEHVEADPVSWVKRESYIYEYMTLEEMTELGVYPLWMQPDSEIIYDENGKPEIIAGGEVSKEEYENREDIKGIGMAEINPVTVIAPNTKVEYDLHGFMQNIYFLWPDDKGYNLSPYMDEEGAKEKYKTFDEITALGYFPTRMQDSTVIIYDENGVPEITKGGEIPAEELEGRYSFVSPGYKEAACYKITPNTKVVYDSAGIIMSIYDKAEE